MVPARRGRLLTARAGIAAVVVVLGAGLAVGSLRHRASVASPDRTYTTTAGQRLSVTLGDGTRLTLAPASRVRVAADYSHPVGAREVELEGEAYFTVTHDAAHPFAVRAHGAVARDVGTAFDVRAYPEDAGARIAVAEGAVAVSATSGCRTAWTTSPDGEGTGPTAAGPCEVEAKAGDVASAEAGGVAIEHHEDVATLTAWTAGALQFQNARLSEIAVQLDRWYGLAIAIPDSAVAAHRMTLSVRDNTADETLSAVAVLAHAKYERSGTRVTFSRTSEDH